MMRPQHLPLAQLAVAIALGLAALAACISPASPVADIAGVPDGTYEAIEVCITPLPPPSASGQLTLEEALAQRRSVRAFSEETLTLGQISQLLWAAQGITDPAGLRTAPSAGGRFPLEVYAITADGVYHYEPDGHLLIRHRAGTTQHDLYAATVNQDSVRDAPLVILVAGVYGRTAERYGEERSPRYVHLEAGHAAQNILLQAVSLELGAVPIGAFYEETLQEILALPEGHQPLYLIPVGHPK
jgi:SagB-type dehydrogenase family enzyme